MQHVVVQRSSERARRRLFLSQIEAAGDETLGNLLDRLDGAESLSAFGAWQYRAIEAELDMRA